MGESRIMLITDKSMKSCPFCGGAGSLYREDPTRDYFVICDSCGCESSWAESQDRAIQLWNARTNDREQELVKRIQEYRQLVNDAAVDYGWLVEARLSDILEGFEAD